MRPRIKPLKGLLSNFYVSEVGKVYSLENVRGNAMPEVLEPFITSSGSACVEMLGKTYLVHELVAKSFLGPPLGKDDYLTHLNGDKTLNTLENLQWKSRIARDLSANEEDVVELLISEEVLSVSEISTLTGIPKINVINIKKSLDNI